MTSDRRKMSDGELRELLQLGDPAADGSEPSHEETAALRRTILNTIDTSPAARPWLSRPLATAAATLAVALIALALLLRAGPWGAVLQPETGPATPAEPTPGAPINSTASSAGVPRAIAAEPSSEPVPTAAGSEDPPRGLEPQAAPEVAAVADLPEGAADQPPLAAVRESLDLAAPVVDREPRTVRFTAPGGTRIIWTLDPDFQLPLSEPDERARGEL